MDNCGSGGPSRGACCGLIGSVVLDRDPEFSLHFPETWIVIDVRLEKELVEPEHP
jgi:hypothetical protein